MRDIAHHRLGSAMNDADRHLMTVFSAALERSPAGERAAFLDEACSGDPELRARVEALLRAHDRPGRFLGPAREAEPDEPSSISITCGGSGRVLETLAASLGHVPRVLLPDTTARDGAHVVRPSSPEMPRPADRPDRVQLLGEIARGGMGAILKGRDPDIGRDLAVKVLLDHHRGQVELVRRFVEEAQIAGQLQHPGVVPVYELGCFADARPYFTMKLVKGSTLAQLLVDRPSPTTDRARFLGVFEQVAQTVVYAHARGVIHRDLKPSNVMVGSFGEVQVMDWGLAKVLPRGGVIDDATAGRGEVPAQETVIATARSGPGGDSDLSRAGSVLGTPSYMAPEQARGDVEAVDERADVFALGSILCEVLTGGPAFTGRTSGEIQRKAARADLADASARLAACGADGELAALARDCLATDPEDRPRHAGIVAERLAAYLGGVQEQLHAAELARAAEVARAEEAVRTAEAAEARSRAERRAQRLTAALAASAVLMTLAGAGGWGWMRQQRAVRGLATTREVEAALREATIGWGRARASTSGDLHAWGEALASARRAESLLSLGEAGEETRRRARATVEAIAADRDAAAASAEEAERDRRLLERLGAIRVRVGDNLDRRQADRDYAAAFREAGIDMDRLAPAEAGARIAARPAKLELTAALAAWIFERQNLSPSDHDGARRLLAVAQAADPDPWRSRLREVIATGDRDALFRLADSVDPLSLPTETVQRFAEALRRVNHDAGRAITLLRPVQRRDAGDFWLTWDLGATLRDTGPAGAEEGVRYLTAAVSIRPGSPFARRALASILGSLGWREEAIAQYQEATRLAPDDAGLRAEFAQLLMSWGEGDRAFAQFAELLRRSPRAASVPLDLLRKIRQGDTERTIHELRAIVKRAPDDAVAHFTLGNELEMQGHIDEAIASYRESTRLRSDAVVFYKLGMALARESRLEEAVAAEREALKLDGSHLGEAIFVLADQLGLLGRFDEAADHLRRAADLARGEGRPDQVRRAEGDLRGIEHRKALSGRLPAILSGSDRPRDAEEIYHVTRLCHARRLDAAAARICEGAFLADPKLADDPGLLNRFNAACSAALAGCGEGADDPPPDAAERARLRGLALAWLRAQLMAWRGRLEGATPDGRAEVARRVGEFLTDPDLAPVRLPAALAKLPLPEQERWRSLWGDVEAVKAMARGEKP